MALALEVTLHSSIEDVEEPELIVMPVARHDGALRVPAGLPRQAFGVDVPTSLETAFAERFGFDAKAGQTLLVAQAPGSPSLLAVGIGDPTSSDAEAWRTAAAAVTRATSATSALFLLPLPSTVPEEALGEAVALGCLLGTYRYSLKTSEDPRRLERVDLVAVASRGLSAQALSELEGGVGVGKAEAMAVATARDLINRIPSEMTPRRLAASSVRRLETAPGVTVEVWREQRIKDERLGGLLGVAKGSAEPPRLVTARYEPLDVPADELGSLPHVVLVGKGITFDSGGLSLKTATGMTTMKTDMSGAAIVLAAMRALGPLGIKARVTAIAPMAENMPSGTAMKPGDVLTARDGTTIEVLNTDAEGRLILADALVLATELEPDVVVDVATLTGAASVALGTSIGAMLTNDDDLAEAFSAAGEASGEHLWRLPLFDGYRSQLDSEIADLKNIGSPGQAGTIIAALFLERFVKGRAWVHLDIAGAGRAERASGVLTKGGTAFGLRAILTYLRTLG